jgi:peptide deformylase
VSLLPIRLWPDPVLAVVCAPVGPVDRGLRGLIADMFATMYAAPGRGLAAPQVGEALRLFVMDLTWKDGVSSPMVMLNPVRLWASEAVATFEEGCLSIPGVLTPVTRPAQVRVGWIDPDLGPRQALFEGISAVCVQHEMDHLDGVVTLDRLSPEDRRLAEGAIVR